jgi:hypothetical protein
VTALPWVSVPPQGSVQSFGASTAQVSAVAVPDSTPSSQVRVCAVQVPL